ncbi:MAG TPA: hypothetical protein VJB67_00760 [Patescibacteria group bacterium]|nr:hypothetical protein [Patescibacteria group bacterium]
MFIAIVIIILIISVFLLFYLIFQHLPDLKNLDVQSLGTQKQDEAKTKIIQAKLSRSSDKLKKRLGVLKAPSQKFILSKFQKIKSKVSALEAHYQADNSQDNDDKKSIEEIIKEVRELIGQQKHSEAEKKLIGVIGRDKDNVMAYELLGELYLENKSYDQAEEIYKYLIRLNLRAGRHVKSDTLAEVEISMLSSMKINPGVAIYYDDLAQVYEIGDKNEQVIDCYLKASAIEPNNPKYLDKLVEFGIKVKDKGIARKTFHRLRKINPENAKLDDYQQAIEKMS